MSEQYPQNGRLFYVSVMNGSRRGLLLGPFETHDEALEQVERVRQFVVERKPEAHFYGFGTASAPRRAGIVGRLNEHIEMKKAS